MGLRTTPKLNKLYSSYESNYIGSTSGYYYPQKEEEKKLIFSCKTQEEFKAAYLLVLTNMFNLSMQEAKTLGVLCELASDSLEFYNTIEVREFISKKTGVCEGCISNALTNLLHAKLIYKQKELGKYKIGKKAYMKFNSKSNKKLVVELKYEF